MDPTPRKIGRSEGLRLGLFGINCSGGIAHTKVEERWRATWPQNKALAEVSDEVGLDFLLPVARWRGYGGATDHHGQTFETITWAAGVLAATQHLTAFATVHTPLLHPVFAAKQMATIDQQSEGRFGVNVVCGWSPDEFGMFGPAQVLVDQRYPQGQEWLDVMTRIWAQEPGFDFKGEFYDLHDVKGSPPTFDGTRPVIMNAGMSAEGTDFAARNADAIFTGMAHLEEAPGVVKKYKDAARTHDRDVDVYAIAYVVCRPTTEEAQDYLHHYAVEERDHEGMEPIVNLMRSRMTEEEVLVIAERWAAGHGGFPLVGTPDEVAGLMADVHKAGFAGLALGFVNYLDEIGTFADEVLPRLEKLGVRRGGV